MSVCHKQGDKSNLYKEQYVQCCKVVLNSSNVVSQEWEEKKKVLCVYLALRTLDWDNRDRFAAFSAKGV